MNESASKRKSVAGMPSLVRRTLVPALVLVVALALPGASSAERPGWYSIPTISGTPAVGATLGGNEAGINCAPPCTPAGPDPSVPGIYFEWRSCIGTSPGGADRPTGGLPDDPRPAEGCVTRIPPTKDARSYVVRPDDNGRYIQLHVIATNYDCNQAGNECRYSSGHGYSSTTGVVGGTPPPPPPPPPPPAPAPPANTVLPSISGLVEHMQTLTVSPGTWVGAEPISFTFQWLRCSTRLGGCRAIENATATEYRLELTDVGTRIVVTIRATNAGGTSTATSARTTHVAPARPRPGNTVLPVSEISAPNALQLASVRFNPGALRRATILRVTIIVKDRRGFMIEGAVVSIGAARGALKGVGKTDGGGRAVMRVRVGRLPASGPVLAAVSAGKPGDPDVRAVKTVRLAVRR